MLIIIIIIIIFQNKYNFIELKFLFTSYTNNYTTMQIIKILFTINSLEKKKKN